MKIKRRIPEGTPTFREPPEAYPRPRRAHPREPTAMVGGIEH